MDSQGTTGNGSPLPNSTIMMERPTRPDPEVPEKATRRKFSAEEKRRILLAADEAERVKGCLGALFRREGIYSSHLKKWREQRERGEIEGLSPRRRGKKPLTDSEARRLRALEKENRRLHRKLKKAELLLSIQKKFAEMMEIELPPVPPELDGDDE